MTWVDASYVVHPNIHSHTGGTMSFVTNTIHLESSEQILITKSSTEAKIVIVSKYLLCYI